MLITKKTNSSTKISCWFISIRLNLGYFAPPDDFGGHFIGKTSNYDELLTMYDSHVYMPFYPFYVLLFYAASTVLWLVFAQGWRKKLWGLGLGLAAFFSLVVWVGIGSIDKTSLVHLDTFVQDSKTYHLFREESLTSGADVYQEFLYLATCQEGQRKCVFQAATWNVFINRKDIAWEREGTLLKVFANGVLVFEHQLRAKTVPSEWMTFRSDEFGIEFKYPSKLQDKIVTITASSSASVQKINDDIISQAPDDALLITKFSSNTISSFTIDSQTDTEKLYVHEIDMNMRCDLLYPQRKNAAGKLIMDAVCKPENSEVKGVVIRVGNTWYFIKESVVQVVGREEFELILESVKSVE